MTGTPVSPKQDALWILCVLLITAAGGSNSPCPTGARIHLSSRRCYWLSEMTSSWPEAQRSCRETQGGDLASADSLELQHFIHYSFSLNTTVWVWLKGSGEERPDQEPVSPAWLAGDSESQRVCTQMALGTQGQWRDAQCAGQYLFLCEKEFTETLPSVDIYLTGLVFMTGMYAQTQIHPLSNVPDIGQLTVEMQLFPGLWFSHAGQLVSVELVVQPSPVSSLARVQILRPYCNPNHHLVPPGCSSLLNPFSCCSAVPLCNTTGGCSIGQYWCHLQEACVRTASPCSPYDSATGGRRFTLPPRYTAIPPFFHLVADLPLRINPSSELNTINLLLTDRGIMVYPDDIVALQHTRNSGTFLHCLNSEGSLNSPWRQSYMSLRGTEWGGWWEGGLTSLPPEGQWVDGVVCDLRMLYLDNLHRGTEHDENLGFTHRETTAAQDIWALTTGPTASLRSKFELDIIHPAPDENNEIHVQIGVATLIVVKVLSGEQARSSWSAPVLQTGVPFLPYCPGELAQAWPGCKTQSNDAWFSSATLVLPSVGVRTLNISVMDAASSQSISVRVCGYETVTGLSVEPHGCLRMVLNTPQAFIAKVESGSSVKFTWVIDNLEKFAHEGESYSVVFKKPADYELRVLASNHVSSQSQQIRLTADEMTPLSNPEFLLISEVVAVDAIHLYTFRVKVDISQPVTFRWGFGDGSSKVIHTQSAPCQSMEGLMERGEKQVYVQDSVNYTYHIPDDYTLHVKVSNQYDNTEASIKISVRPQLNHLLISSSPLVPLVKETLFLEASAEPSAYAVVFTWDFDDGSEDVQGIHHKVSHTFASAGTYNVTVHANNTLAVLTTWLIVEVFEKISGLTVSYNGPNELSSPTVFRATVVTGTSLMWNFDFGDGSPLGNLTNGPFSHIYKLPGNYTVDVTVSNSVSQAHQSISVEVYELAVSGVLPTECVISGRDIQLTTMVNGNIPMLTFHWLFGDGSPLTVVKGQSTVMHKYQSQRIFHVSLTVFSVVTSVSLNTSICVEAPISSIEVQSSQEVVAVGGEVCFKVMVSPEPLTGYQFKWSSSPSSLTAMTDNAQKCFIFKDEGVEEILVMASNKVDNKTAKSSITIQNPVRDLSVGHDCQGDTLMINTLVSFVFSCTGSNVSVLWDFGDGSAVEQNQNASHVFIVTGQFTVTATAFNAVSRDSVTLKVNVLLPVSDLSLHTNQPYAVVGDKILISAISSAISSTNYYWTVDGETSTKQGSYEFKFAFPKPGVYQVRVIAQNLVSRKEATILIQVFERIEGLQIECQSLTNMKYIPTQEELLFIASITKGSNVTYHWVATQSGISKQITGDGELFHMLAETSGLMTVQLKASNKLGEATTIVSLVAVQPVTSAHIRTQADIVPLGKLVNISVSVATGSDLQYFWYVKSDLPPMQTQVPFLLHTFTHLGHCLLNISVQNVLSQSNATKEFNVQEEVQEVDFEIKEKTHPFYITTTNAVSFNGLVRKGSDLHWNWKVGGVESMFFNATNQTFIYTFPVAGLNHVSLNVSNGINWQMISHSVTVQDAIEGLIVNISKLSYCTEERVTFFPTISKGSNVSFVISFRDNEWIHSQSILNEPFPTSGLPAGTHVVTVKASNQVSSAEVSSSILIAERIQGLRLVNCCSAALEALREIQFKAEVQSGMPVNYTWSFYMVGSEPMLLLGQQVTLTPPDSGLMSVSVIATNGVCSKMLNATATIQWSVNKVKLVSHSERIFVGHAVRFSAKVNGGSDMRYLWNFGDSTEESVTDLSTVSHTYHIPGMYTVMVKVFNSVSHVYTQLLVEVKELQCSSPQASLVQSNSTIFRSRPSLFEASVDSNCSAYKTKYLWEIHKESNCTNANLKFSRNQVILKTRVDAASPFLSLPKHTLDMGHYCLVLTVSLQGTPLFVQRKTTITVVHSPLVAAIKGGSHRLWPSLSDLVLDGAESQDPDVEPGMEDTLQYHWSFVTLKSSTFRLLKQPIGNNSSRITVLGTQLHPGTVYISTLTVHKAGRTPSSANQTVTVCDVPVLPVIVQCVSCSALSSPHHSYSSPIFLSGQCGHCDDQVQYKWSAEDQAGMSLDLNEVTTSTGRHFPNLVVRSGVLQPGQSYTFTLNVSQPAKGQWGSASFTILPNNPPHGGVCDLTPESDTRLMETVVTYHCSGWQDDESRAPHLIYTFQVAPCQPMGKGCPLLTLYRGTRSTFGSLVPMGIPGQEGSMSVITVTLLVEDHLGAKVIALNRTLTVENPARDKVASQWLKNKSQTELWTLVQHGNPQEVIPYSVALTSQLNQMESGQIAWDLMDRREIRQNVTKALASLPVYSLPDVDQISSALSQSTAVPSELVCEDCQVKVLEAVGKMIQVMIEQTGPGVSSAVETGRNILNILGSILAAASESTSVSSSHKAYSSTLQSTSTNGLSALGHARALMCSLMHSHVHGEAPLMLSTPYINTIGFRGDPSNLLCTNQLNQSNPNQIIPSQSSSNEECRFHIPTSLTDHLKSQETEVVQILLGMDAERGSNPLIAAANPPISTTLVGMELTTPQGQPIPIRDLNPEQAIRVTLPNKYPGGQDSGGGKDTLGEAGNGTCLTVTLPAEGRLNLTVKALDGLNENAGLYISFNFSLDPGATPVSLAHVKVEVSATGLGTNGSQDSLVREWTLALSPQLAATEETIFLSPLLNGTDRPLSVSLFSSLPGGGGPVHASVCVFSSLCQYYSVEDRRWSSEGLQPLEGSTLHAAHCLTQHLTMFGASMFVHPGAVVLLPPPGGPVRNTVVGIVCAVLVVIHLLLGLIAHKLDHMDRLRLSQVPLCGRPGLYHYRVLVKTGQRRGAGTTAHVGISLYGVNKSGSRHLQRDGAFQRGGLDQFHLETDDNLGEVWKIRIWHDNTGLDPTWYVQHVVVWDPQTDHMFFFLLDDWLSVENQRTGTVEKEVLASCPEELSQFGRVFASQLMFGMTEHHLWLSLWERRAHSRFTGSQRVTTSALILHLYLALGALWYGAVGTQGQSGPVSARMLLNLETVAVGMTVAALVFPLQCFFCFLFTKAHSPVAVEVSAPPSLVCHSVEMDVYLGQSELSRPSFLSLADSSGHVRDSLSSESKAFDSSILDFWAASGLAPQRDGRCGEEKEEEEGMVTWPSCDSLLNLPVTPCLSSRSPPALGPARQLRRKKALMQLCLASRSTTGLPTAAPLSPLSKDISIPAQAQEVTTVNPNSINAHNRNLTTLLTLSEEDLLMSIAAEDTADVTHSSSDSGRDSPRTTSSLSNTRSTSCSSWSDQSDDRSLYGADLHKSNPQSPPSLYGTGLYKCPSALSVDSVASTFLPSPSPDSTSSSSTTRIGVARGEPSWLLPPWALCVLYPLVSLLIGGCLAVVGLYGSFMSRTVLLMWLVSAFSAFLTSALLLEPLKVCVQALISTVLWRPVDPEVEDHLAQETTVVKTHLEPSGKVRPPCGYGLLQAKEEARKVRALRSLMRHCACQLLFVLLVLMVNYQDSSEQRHGRLLHSVVTRCLHRAPWGVPNLTSLTGFKSISIDFTHYQRESALFVCVSLQLEWAHTHRVTPSLSIHPLLIPSSFSGPDLQVALTALLLISALLILLGELWSMSSERVQYLRQCRHWFQLLLALLSLVMAILQLFYQSQASSCISELRSQPDNFIDFHSAALLAQKSSQCAAVLLTLLVLKLLGTLRFVRRWVVLGTVLHRAWREMWALIVLLLLLLLICTHLGHTLFSRSVEGFMSVRQTGVSVLSIFRGRMALQRLCRVHPVLGPLYGLLLMGGGGWLLARLCGTVLIRTYRAEKAELHRPNIEPQDFEMVEFFIKRLKLWMGLTKAKEFRHRVKFEGMEVPPSRSSQDSRLSTLSSTFPSSRSPSLSSSFSYARPLSSALSVRSEDSEPGLVVQPYLDRLLPCISALLSRFDQVNQITEDVHSLEMKLEDARTRIRRKRTRDKPKGADISKESTKPKELEGVLQVLEKEKVRQRRKGLIYPKPRISLPSSFSFAPSTTNYSTAMIHNSGRTRRTLSESESSHNHTHEAAKLASGICGLNPANSARLVGIPRRRAWHSGTSHSADAAQRIFLAQGGNGGENFASTNTRPSSEDGVRRNLNQGVPVKRKAWICEGSETEQD